MGVLKKKAVIIFLAVFACLFVGIQIIISLQEDDFDELESKFPLEDYLFADSKDKQEIERLKKQLEEEQANKQKGYSEIDEQLKKLQEQIANQQNTQQSPYRDLYDENGNKIMLDESGNPIILTESGERVYLDENGNPYKLDEHSNRVYIDKDTPLYTEDGTLLKRDESGNIVFKDKDGNNVVVEGNKRTTTDKDGNIINDKQGNQGGQKSQEEENQRYDINGNPIKDDNADSKKGSKGEQDKNFLYDENGNIIGDSVAKENQKFDPAKASDKQKNINNILASRFEGSVKKEEKRKNKNIEYGVNEFTNLDDKDEGSNEHKLLRTITADRLIPAFLVRPISSQLAGSVVAQVETNIYGAMGRVVLIPKGSRVIGFYESNNKIGEYRLNVIWTRIITPQGINILLTDARGADVKGYNGLVGEVHSRNFQRYGIPLTLSTLSNGLLLAVNSLNSKYNSQSGGNGNADIASAYMTAQIMGGMRQDVSTIIQRIVQEQMKIQPIITIREGSRVFIAPNRDIFIPIPKKGETLARFFREEVPENPEGEEDKEADEEETDNEL